MQDEYLNSLEAAEFLKVSDRTIRTLCRNRKIKHERLNGRNIRFKREWLEDYQKSITVEPINEEKGEL